MPSTSSSVAARPLCWPVAQAEWMAIRRTVPLSSSARAEVHTPRKSRSSLLSCWAKPLLGHRRHRFSANWQKHSSSRCRAVIIMWARASVTLLEAPSRQATKTPPEVKDCTQVCTSAKWIDRSLDGWSRTGTIFNSTASPHAVFVTATCSSVSRPATTTATTPCLRRCSCTAAASIPPSPPTKNRSATSVMGAWVARASV
mmetsp:Transcript_104105/g.238382  ORF Transcript_104105/g.238382 Transcript_104105/m.238382 type:complete len:200 (-) Transcript_104105:676-1275(-)